MKFSLAALTRRARNPRRDVIPLRPIVAPGTLASNLYAEAYRPIVALWQGAVERIISEYERSLAEITTDSPADLSAVVGSAEAEGRSVVLTVGARLTAWAATIEAWHRRKWRANVLSATGVDLATLLGPGDVRMTLEAAIERNVALVRSVGDETRQKIADAVFRGLQERTPVRDVAKRIHEVAEMGRRRALNLAADQTVKITASLNDERRRQAGIDAWEWVHSGKAHPREEHKARNGLLYSDDPALVGAEEGGKRVRTPPQDRPGQLPYCGCTSRAVLLLSTAPVVLREDVSTKAKREVLERGKRINREVALAIDEATGAEVGRATGTAFEATLSARMIAAMSDPQQKIVLHHNHPRSSSFSYADIAALQSHPGLRRIFAHGHNGSTFIARDANLTRADFDKVHGRVIRALETMVAGGVLTQKQAALLEAHAVWAVMDRKGLLNYKYRFAGSSRTAYARAADAIDQMVTDIAKAD